MLPSLYRSATISLIYHFATSRISISTLSSPTHCLIRFIHSSCEGFTVKSVKPGSGSTMNIHSFHGSTIRTITLQAQGGWSISGWKVQCNTPSLCAMNLLKSIFACTLIASPCPGSFFNGIPSCRITWLRPPSHPNKYLLRI